MMEERLRTKLPRTIHPLVYSQPETGRKVLNVSPWFANAIEGMENAEGDAILQAVVEHSVRPDLAYFHGWLPEDMVLWDNWRMIGPQRARPLVVIHGDRRRIMPGPGDQRLVGGAGLLGDDGERDLLDLVEHPRRHPPRPPGRRWRMRHET